MLTSFRASSSFSLANFSSPFRKVAAAETATTPPPQLQALVTAARAANPPAGPNFGEAADAPLPPPAMDYVLAASGFALNDYITAISAHTCYWENKDTVFFMLSVLDPPV